MRFAKAVVAERFTKASGFAVLCITCALPRSRARPGSPSACTLTVARTHRLPKKSSGDSMPHCSEEAEVSESRFREASAWHHFLAFPRGRPKKELRETAQVASAVLRSAAARTAVEASEPPVPTPAPCPEQRGPTYRLITARADHYFMTSARSSYQFSCCSVIGPGEVVVTRHGAFKAMQGGTKMYTPPAGVRFVRLLSHSAPPHLMPPR